MNFRQAVFMILGEGQELSGAEKALAGEVVDSFISDYVAATKEKPLPLFFITDTATLYLYKFP